MISVNNTGILKYRDRFVAFLTTLTNDVPKCDSLAYELVIENLIR